MRADPALTYRGALAILGRRDHTALRRLDRLLGGVILGGGVAGIDWLIQLIDAKGEAKGLLERFADGLGDRLLGTSGYARHQLISAAHTTLVVSSFFDAFREVLGKGFAALELTDQEKVAIAGGDPEYGGVLDQLWRCEIPMPWPARGFQENLDLGIGPYLRTTAERCLQFVSGLFAWAEIFRHERPEIPAMVSSIVDGAKTRYHDAYRRMASEVPEFNVWAMLAEHGATQLVLRDLQRDMRSLEEILGGLAAPGAAAKPRSASHRATIAAINRAVLDRPILPADVSRYSDTVRVPTIEESYVTPGFAYAVAGRHARLADESWWRNQKLGGDLNVFMAGYFSSPESAKLPLVVLGHPGAGKSLLTEMLAARLPAEGFTPVRVQLRRVAADAPVYEQIQHAIETETHGRVDWAGLSDECGDATLRVVMLDGLDELMQATGAAQSRYLHDVADFQQREAELGRPVAVVVTSRTIVADRTHFPSGCLVIRLEDFSNEQIDRWLRAWNAANLGVEGFEPLTRTMVLSAGELARQPLLLLMLALYATDPEAPAITNEIRTSAELYDRLLDNFIGRELTKSADRTDADGQDQRWRLSLAAFAMFNRGRQFAAEEELDRDVSAFFGAPAPVRRDLAEPMDHAARTLGQFFFVHASSALDKGSGLGGARRTYEFLHGTFGEYLIADRIIRLLQELAEQRLTVSQRRSLPFAGRSDDGALRALLSHQPLGSHGRILTFAAEATSHLAAELPEAIAAVIEELLRSARTRPETGPPGYAPGVNDAIDRLAVYTANLAILRVRLPSEHPEVPVARLAPADVSDPVGWWRSLVHLWRASLDGDGWAGLVDTLDCDGQVLRPREPNDDWLDRARQEYGEARLLGDLATEHRIRLGLALGWPDAEIPGGDVEWRLREVLLHILVGTQYRADLYEEHVFGLLGHAGVTGSETAFLLAQCLARDAAVLSPHRASELVRRIGMAPHNHALAPDLASILGAHPGVLRREPWVRDVVVGAPLKLLRRVQLILGGLDLRQFDGADSTALAALKTQVSRRVNQLEGVSTGIEYGTGTGPLIGWE